MTVLDASVLIGFLAADDAHHESSTSVMRSLVDSVIVVHPITLAEVLVLPVRRGIGDEVRAELMEQGLRVASDDGQAPLRLARLRVDTGLRLPDCCVLDTVLREGTSLASFDERLVAAARSMGVEVLDVPA